MEKVLKENLKTQSELVISFKDVCGSTSGKELLTTTIHGAAPLKNKDTHSYSKGFEAITEKPKKMKDIQQPKQGIGGTTNHSPCAFRKIILPENNKYGRTRRINFVKADGEINTTLSFSTLGSKGRVQLVNPFKAALKHSHQAVSLGTKNLLLTKNYKSLTEGNSVAPTLKSEGPLPTLPPQNLTEKEVAIELQEARLIQMLYCENHASLCFLKQKRAAKTQISAIWQLNEKLKRDNAKLRQSIRKAHHLMTSYTLVENFVNNITACTTNLEVFNKNFNKFLIALKTTLYRIQTLETTQDNLHSLPKTLALAENAMRNYQKDMNSTSNAVKEVAASYRQLEERIKQQHEGCSSADSLLGAIASLEIAHKSTKAQYMLNTCAAPRDE